MATQVVVPKDIAAFYKRVPNWREWMVEVLREEMSAAPPKDRYDWSEQQKRAYDRKGSIAVRHRIGRDIELKAKVNGVVAEFETYAASQ